MTSAFNSKPAASLSQTDLSVIDQFKKQARDFWRLYTTMGDDARFVATQNNSVQKEYADLMSRGQTIRSGVERATSVVDGAGSMIDSARNWFSDTFGLSGLRYAEGLAGTQLGFIPLIPIAVVAGSLALIGKWVNDALVFNRRINEMKRLQSQGMTPNQAANIIDKIMPKGFGASVTGLVMPIALVGAIVLLPRLLKKKRG